MDTTGKKRTLAAIVACLLPSLALAEYGNATISEVISIYDADTFRAIIDG
ncbi:hypothetical protein [Modicisalibacter luteus]|uniref:Uncharacterized protein n=1 Tax=Modicisalibacter luteus TaxID=453962 RepID=A0ABV7M3R0_9GAMM|nr:hypothetical protein [Halomonas lutea]GHA85600.1 hypothetical protein GCM10007159_03450 [Halomonas lutea]